MRDRTNAAATGGDGVPIGRDTVTHRCNEPESGDNHTPSGHD